jgi:hypothetical protein
MTVEHSNRCKRVTFAEPDIYERRMSTVLQKHMFTLVPLSMVRPTPLKVLANRIPKTPVLEFIVGVDTKQLQDCPSSVIEHIFLFRNTLNFTLETGSEFRQEMGYSGHEPGKFRRQHSQPYTPVSYHLPSWLQKREFQSWDP